MGFLQFARAVFAVKAAYSTPIKMQPNTNTPAPTAVGKRIPYLNSGFQFSFLLLQFLAHPNSLLVIGGDGLGGDGRTCCNDDWRGRKRLLLARRHEGCDE